MVQTAGSNLPIRKFVIGGGTALVLLFVFLFTDIDPIAILVDGLQVGAVYSLVALGLALVYKATRVLNFAQGELGTLPAFAAFFVLAVFIERGPDIGFWDVENIATTDVTGLQMLGATFVAMIFGALLAIFINVAIVQRLAESSAITSLVATAGVAVLITSGELVAFDAQARKFPRFIGGSAFTIADVAVPWHSLIVIAVLIIAAGALAIFFQTPPGIALLATAQDPFAAEIYGISPRAMSTLAWGTAGALGALSGVLGGGVFESLSPGLMTTTFLIPAFTAAVLGGLTSMVGAVIGGLMLGITVVFANETVLAYDLTSTIPGPPTVMTFAVLMLVLLFRPRGLFGKEA